MIREEAKSPITKNVNSISLAREEKERSDKTNETLGNTVKPTRIETRIPVKEAERNNEAENKPIEKAEKEEVQRLRSPSWKVKGKTYNVSLRRPVLAETDIRLSLASHSYIYPLGIAEDVLVDVAEHVYPVDFVILDVKEDEKRPFILGTPFLTTAKAVTKFDKGTITLKSGKSKISFHRIPESSCKIEKGVKNDIEPIAPIMTVNRLVLEWEERIKLHLEKEMKFNQ
ncbi:reverse transcriptase domain-containing protein [Tanacetum coccineum]